MPLFRRLLLLSVILALAAAFAVDFVVRRVRMADQDAFLDRVATSFLTDIVRDACHEDPRWFLAGPRTGRPSLAARQMPDAEVYLPRPRQDPLPFEFFPYDEGFVGSSTASPRFPDELRTAFRRDRSRKVASGAFETPEGDGRQLAKITDWTPGPCAVLLFRLRPMPGAGLQRALIFATVFAIAFGVAVLAFWPTAARIRRLMISMRESVRRDYADKVSVSGTDEIASLAATFNEASAELRRRMTDAVDREEALQRHVTQTSEDVATPLAAAAEELAPVATSSDAPPQVRSAARDAVRAMHLHAMRLQNLAAVAKLRQSHADNLPRSSTDILAVVREAIDDRQSLARVSGVTIVPSLPAGPVTYDADAELLGRAIGNVLDNAIVFNREGGRVDVELKSYEGGRRFSLRIADDGPGVTDDEYAGLTANKRYRGDEARSRRDGGRGLGLALAREIADRHGLVLDLRRPERGGLEAEFSLRRG